MKTIVPLLLTTFLSALTYSAHATPTAFRVTNGTDVQDGQFPWMTLLFEAGTDPELDLFLCGGTLVDKSYILTAAHCLFSGSSQPVSPSRIQVLIGRTTLSSRTGELRDVSRVLVHPSYDDLHFVPVGDLALLKLSEPVSFPPVSLATTGDINEANTFTIAGWGIKDAEEFDVFPDTLQRAEVELQDNAYCRSVYGLLYRQQEMICAATLASTATSSDGIDTCSGDSGGPLLGVVGGETRQFGITSFGFACADDRFPGVYTRIALYHSWILDTIRYSTEFEENIAELLHLSRQLRGAKHPQAAVKRLKRSIRSLIITVTAGEEVLLGAYRHLGQGRLKRIARLVRLASAPNLSQSQRSAIAKAIAKLVRRVAG